MTWCSLVRRVAHSTAGDRTGRIHGAEGAALGTVGQPGCATEVQFAGGVDDHSVADHHGVHDCGLVAGRRGLVGVARRVAPNRSPVVSLAVVWSTTTTISGRPRRAPPPSSNANNARGAQVGLFVEQIGGAAVGLVVVEQGLDLGVEAVLQPEHGFGVPGCDPATHPGVAIDPGVQPDRPPLSLQAGISHHRRSPGGGLRHACCGRTPQVSSSQRPAPTGQHQRTADRARQDRPVAGCE